MKLISSIRGGLLDLTNEALGQLDLVIASLHPDEFEQVDGKISSFQSMINAYAEVCRNPNVDVLGHPVRHSEERVMTLGNLPPVEAWQPIFEAMITNKVAYEINIRSLNLPDHNKQIIQAAMTAGCEFSLGFDFHHFEKFNDLGRTTPEELSTQDLSRAEQKIVGIAQAIEGVGDVERETYLRDHLTADERAKLRFLESKGEPNLQLFLRLRRLMRELSGLGLSSERVINSSAENLTAWLSVKHQPTAGETP